MKSYRPLVLMNKTQQKRAINKNNYATSNKPKANNENKNIYNKIKPKYVEFIEGEINKTSKEIYLESVGKYNPRDHLESTIEELVADNLNVTLTNMLNNLVF